MNSIEVPCLRPTKYLFRGPTGRKGLYNCGMAESVAVSSLFFFQNEDLLSLCTHNVAVFYIMLLMHQFSMRILFHEKLGGGRVFGPLEH